MLPWHIVDSVQTAAGELTLHRRGEQDFRMTIDGRVLMVSQASRSEQELARLGCAAARKLEQPAVLIGGLGMGFTLRAALEQLPAMARITMCEITQTVVDWCRGPLADLTGGAVNDPRVIVEIANVALVIRQSTGRFDAILLDLYEGPNAGRRGANGAFYSARAIARAHAALRPGGTFAVWSEDPDAAFEKRLRASNTFQVECRRIAGGGRHHVVYLARRS